MLAPTVVWKPLAVPAKSESFIGPEAGTFWARLSAALLAAFSLTRRPPRRRSLNLSDPEPPNSLLRSDQRIGPAAAIAMSGLEPCLERGDLRRLLSQRGSLIRDERREVPKRLDKVGGHLWIGDGVEFFVAAGDQSGHFCGQEFLGDDDGFVLAAGVGAVAQEAADRQHLLQRAFDAAQVGLDAPVGKPGDL